MGSDRHLFTDWISPLITVAFLILVLASSRSPTLQAPTETVAPGVDASRPC